jgi:pimeloyl-ACP methyl ester carboxylesterase
MIRLNLRNGDSTIRFGDKPEWSEVDGPLLTETQVAARLGGKKAAVLVHGYNVEDAFDAYARINLHIEACYDEVIGVSWPGSHLEFAFWFACWRAEKAGRLLAAALEPIEFAALDIEGHSLGCMVALEALDHGVWVRNCILAAAAVDNESIQETEQYALAVQRAQRVLVAFSRHDPVLRGAYRVGMWDSALGLTGPQNIARCNPRIVPLDCSDTAHRHGDYKRDQRFFEAWRSLVA